MKKSFLLLTLIVVTAFAITTAFTPVETSQMQTSYECVLDMDSTPIVYQANIFTTVLEWLKTLDIGSIITLLFAGGFLGIMSSFKKAKKEVLELLAEFKKAMADGKITQDESKKLIKELEEAITATSKLWYLFAGVFKKKPSK